jgi:hypothetical protein
VRTVAAEPVARAGSAERFGLDPRASTDAAMDRTTPFSWVLPDGWQLLPQTPMRLANIAVVAAPKIDCSLSVLPGGAGGVAANLNRWRKQMSLPDLSAQEMQALPQLDVLGRKALRLECTGTYRGMGQGEPLPEAMLVGLAVEHEDQVVFVKMVGPKSDVERESGRFDDFCRSLAEADTHPHGGAHADLATGSPEESAPQRWEAPPSWRRVQAGSMRLVSFEVGSNDPAEVYVTVLGGAAGGLAANVNRWRQQMAQPELSATEIAALPSIPMLGRQGKLVRIRGDFTGMDGTTKGDAMMLAAVCELPDRAVFVKMVGAAGTVAPEEERFAAFCRSLQ